DDRFAIQIGGEIEQVRFHQQLPRPESGADPDVDRGRVTLPVPSDIAGVDPDSRCHLPVREGDVGSGDPQFTTPSVTVFDDAGQMEQVTERISGTPGVSIFDHQSDRAGGDRIATIVLDQRCGIDHEPVLSSQIGEQIGIAGAVLTEPKVASTYDLTDRETLDQYVFDEAPWLEFLDIVE